MSAFSQRLSELMKKHDISDSEMAEHFNVSRTTVSRWRKGERSPKMSMMRPIGAYFNVSPTEFIESELIGDEVVKVESFFKIPVLGDKLNGGTFDLNKNIIDYKLKAVADVPDGKVFYLKATDNSMQPTVNEGSHVMFRRQDDAESGDIVAIVMEETYELKIRRLKKQGAILMFIPDNHDYDLIVPTEENKVRIVGKALEVTQKI